MSSPIVKIGIDTIKTTVTERESDINRLVKTFLSNKNNKKMIGLDTERAQKARKQNKTVLLQLCDGDNCLIVQLPNDDEDEDQEEDDSLLPLSLFNFLNLPDFTFVGIGIHKTLMKLESEFGLTCKNAVDVGPTTWNKTTGEKDLIGTIVLTEKPASAVFEDWENSLLDKNQIKIAASNAYFAFALGNILLNGFGF